MKQIIFYGLSIALSWTAIGFLLNTYNATQNSALMAAQHYQKTATTGHALGKNTATEADDEVSGSATDDTEMTEEIPVTIMLIPSPQPMAKPPKSGKDAAPPPMDI